MEAKPTAALNSNNKVYAFSSEMKMSKFQPIDVKPIYGRKWVTNGENNINFRTYKDA